jgi:hypothetical protein
MKGFQPDWEKQTKLAVRQQEMTTAYLLHFDLSLPAMVRWIGSPHVGVHRNNTGPSLPAFKKHAAMQTTKSSFAFSLRDTPPTSMLNAPRQSNYKAYRVYSNHSSFMENMAIVGQDPSERPCWGLHADGLP